MSLSAHRPPAKEIQGSCPSCGHGAGHNHTTAAVVECADCGLPWPSEYWRAQA